jgi:hypothetical protein
MSPPVYSLPNEMLLMVSRSLNTIDLFNLSLSAKMFAPIVQDVLYESITILKTRDKVPFSKVLDALIAQPGLRSKVKSIHIKRQSCQHIESSAGRNFKDQIKDVWEELGHNSEGYEQWAARAAPLDAKTYASVILSLLPNVVKLDIASLLHFYNGSKRFYGSVPFPAHHLSGTAWPVAPQIACLSKLRDLTLAWPSHQFLSLGFPQVTDLTILYITYDTFRYRNTQYHLPSLKNLTIEVPITYIYTPKRESKISFQQLLDTLNNPALDRLTVKVEYPRFCCHSFSFQHLTDNVIYAANINISELCIHTHKIRRLKGYIYQYESFTSKIHFPNLRRLSLDFSALFGNTSTTVKNVTKILPRKIQQIHISKPDKDVLVWLNMLEVAKDEYPVLETLVLKGGMETPEWTPARRLVLQKKVKDFEKLGIRIRILKG